MKRLFLFSLIVLGALCAGVYTVTPNSSIAIGTFNEYKEQFFGTEVEAEADAQKEKLRFVGDVMLARNVEHLMDEYGSVYPFSGLGVHPEDSYLIGNFEAAIPKTHVPTQSMQFTFSVRPEYAKAMREFGFTHAGIANNHSNDHGREGFLNTAKVLEDYGVLPFGATRGQSTSTIQIVKSGETDIALVGLYAVDTLPSNSEIETLIKRAEGLSDIQIVYVHWGDEYKPIHNMTQEYLAHVLIDQGADVIIGHHPHVVQDVEKYKGKLIFYSLGNFIFDQYFSDEVQNGLMLEMALSEGEITFGLLPVSSIGSRSVTRFMADYEKEAFLKDLAKKSDTELSGMIQDALLKTPQ